jgi:hypothetical protein
LFFTLELNRLKDADLEAKLANPLWPLIGRGCAIPARFRQHRLSDELEWLS